MRYDLLHALIVDDDADVRQTLRMILEEIGFRVEEAPSGVEAMDTLLVSSDRLLVMLDLMMPRMTGLDVLQLVALNAALASHHLFVIMTANPGMLASASPEATALIRERGIRVILKPFDLDELLALVEAEKDRLIAAPVPKPAAGAESDG